MQCALCTALLPRKIRRRILFKFSWKCPENLRQKSSHCRGFFCRKLFLSLQIADFAPSKKFCWSGGASQEPNTVVPHANTEPPHWSSYLCSSESALDHHVFDVVIRGQYEFGRRQNCCCQDDEQVGEKSRRQGMRLLPRLSGGRQGQLRAIKIDTILTRRLLLRKGTLLFYPSPLFQLRPWARVFLNLIYARTCKLLLK